jgi:hypothetical protein
MDTTHQLVEVKRYQPKETDGGYPSAQEVLMATRLYVLAVLLCAMQVMCLIGMVVVLQKVSNPLATTALLVALLSFGRSFRIVIAPSVTMRNSSNAKDKDQFHFDPQSEPLNVETVHGILGWLMSLLRFGYRRKRRRRVGRRKPVSKVNGASA